MAFTTKNTFGNSTLGVLGIRGYFLPSGGTAATDWIDLGVINSWEPSDDTETLEITGARSGLTVVHEALPISASLSYAFDSGNPNDQSILALWNGSAMTADVATEGHAAPFSFDATNGKLVWVRQNAQASKPHQLLVHPGASIRRSGIAGTPGEEAAALSFEVTVTADETYKIPAAVLATNPDAPYGYLHVVSTAGLTEAIEHATGTGS